MVDGMIKLIDFGISSEIPDGRTHATILNPSGTIDYIAPETLRVRYIVGCQDLTQLGSEVPGPICRDFRTILKINLAAIFPSVCEFSFKVRGGR